MPAPCRKHSSCFSHVVPDKLPSHNWIRLQRVAYCCPCARFCFSATIPWTSFSPIRDLTACRCSASYASRRWPTTYYATMLLLVVVVVALVVVVSLMLSFVLAMLQLWFKFSVVFRFLRVCLGEHEVVLVCSRASFAAPCHARAAEVLALFLVLSYISVGSSAFQVWRVCRGLFLRSTPAQTDRERLVSAHEVVRTVRAEKSRREASTAQESKTIHSLRSG